MREQVNGAPLEPTARVSPRARRAAQARPIPTGAPGASSRDAFFSLLVRSKATVSDASRSLLGSGASCRIPLPMPGEIPRVRAPRVIRRLA